MRSIIPTSLNIIPNSIQTDWNLCKVIAAEMFAFFDSCDLEPGSRPIRSASGCKIQQYLSLSLWIKSIQKYPITWNRLFVCLFLTQSLKQQLLPLFYWIFLKSSIRMFNLTYFNTYQNFSLSFEKCARKWSQEVLPCTDIVAPSQVQGHWQWHNLVEVNGAYIHGMDENNWLTSLPVMSNINIFAMQDGQPAGHSARWTQLIK